MRVDKIIVSLIEKHPDLLESFEGGDWESLLIGEYPEDVETKVLQNIVSHAHFKGYLSKEVILLKKDNVFTLGGEALCKKQNYEIPVLAEESSDKENVFVESRSHNKTGLNYLLYTIVLVVILILGTFLVTNSSKANNNSLNTNENKVTSSKKEKIIKNKSVNTEASTEDKPTVSKKESDENKVTANYSSEPRQNQSIKEDGRVYKNVETIQPTPAPNVNSTIQPPSSSATTSEEKKEEASQNNENASSSEKTSNEKEIVSSETQISNENSNTEKENNAQND